MITSTELPSTVKIARKVFGEHYFMFEHMVYDRIKNTFSGCDLKKSWKTYRLSNDGFFIAPNIDCDFHLSNTERKVATPVTGIVGCLHALNELAWTTRNDLYLILYYRLFMFVNQHPERELIILSLYKLEEASSE